MMLSKRSNSANSPESKRDFKIPMIIVRLIPYCDGAASVKYCGRYDISAEREAEPAENIEISEIPRNNNRSFLLRFRSFLCFYMNK